MTKQEILNFIKDNTESLCDTDSLRKLNTKYISDILNLSRSLASQHLNDLFKESLLVKIVTRPVYYLSVNKIEEFYNVKFDKFEFLSIEELKNYVQKASSRNLDFHKIIGFDTTFDFIINQIKAAINYPHGLPIMLYGQKGVGKHLLSQVTFEYCVNNKILNRDSKFMIYKVSSSEKNNISKKLLEIIQDKSKEGLLYIKNSENLSDLTQEKLVDVISKGINKNLRIIFSTEINPINIFNKSFLLNTPVVCNIPNFYERSLEEKREIVYSLFLENQKKFNSKFKVSEKLINYFIDYKYENNIDELMIYIKSTFANAFINQKNEDTIYIYIHHLPTQMLRELDITQNIEEDKFYDLSEIVIYKKESKITTMWSEIINTYINNKYDFNTFLKESQITIREYYDLLFFENYRVDEKIKIIENLVSEILNKYKNSKNINMSFNSSYMLSRMIAIQKDYNHSFKLWQEENIKNIKDLLNLLEEELKDEFIIANLIRKNIEYNLNINIGSMNLIFLILNIKFYNSNLINQDTLGIIISHGYSTASSIAEAANSLLGQFIFESLDMPLNTEVKEISYKVQKFINENLHLKNIILLVDMGSLEHIGDDISSSVNIGVINNISTSMALNIGMKILQGIDIKNMLDSACKEITSNYKLLSVAKKEKAILFINDVDILVAKKLARLFKESLPKNIELKLFDYDYHELKKNELKDRVFEIYDVLLMIAPIDLKIKNIESVSLEQIINSKEIGKVERVLSNYLNDLEIEKFKESLLKNFSLQSLLENLTILNAPRLLDSVEDFINSLQYYTKIKLNSKTRVGIYIHTCLLVERLVTKNQIEKYDNLDEFIRENSNFINYAKKAFDRILSFYNVEIPISEIAYLYDYIKHNDRESTEENEF